MEDILLDLIASGRVGTLKVYFNRPHEDRDALFPRLYQNNIWTDDIQLP